MKQKFDLIDHLVGGATGSRDVADREGLVLAREIGETAGVGGNIAAPTAPVWCI